MAAARHGEAPNELPDIATQNARREGGTEEKVVRVPWNEPVMVKSLSIWAREPCVSVRPVGGRGAPRSGGDAVSAGRNSAALPARRRPTAMAGARLASARRRRLRARQCATAARRRTIPAIDRDRGCRRIFYGHADLAARYGQPAKTPSTRKSKRRSWKPESAIGQCERRKVLSLREAATRRFWRRAYLRRRRQRLGAALRASGGGL